MTIRHEHLLQAICEDCFYTRVSSAELTDVEATLNQQLHAAASPISSYSFLLTQLYDSWAFLAIVIETSINFHQKSPNSNSSEVMFSLNFLLKFENTQNQSRNLTIT